MTPQEVSKVLGLPFEKLFELARNKEDFLRILSVFYREGIAIGTKRTHSYYNRMFREYEASIKN